MYEFLTNLPFRCIWKGQHADIMDYHNEQDTYLLHFGVENGKEVIKWVDISECEPCLRGTSNC